jgi:outer membrane protein
MRIPVFMVLAVIAFNFTAGQPEARAQEGQGDIMFINLDSVFTNYYKTKDAEAELKEQADEFKAEREQKIAELEALKAEYDALRGQAQSAALNEEARNARRAEAEDKLLEMRNIENDIRQREQAAQRRMDEQSRRVRTRLIGEINEIVQNHALTRGYHAIIDYSGNSLNGVPTVVFHNPKFDITAEIIGMLNARRR